MQDAFGVDRSDISKAAMPGAIESSVKYFQGRRAAATSAARAGSLRSAGGPSRVLGSKRLGMRRTRNAAKLESKMDTMRTAPYGTKNATWIDTLAGASKKQAKDWSYVTSPKGYERANWKAAKNALKANSRKSQGPTTPSPFN